MENTLNSEISNECLYISVNTNDKNILVLSIYAIWDGSHATVPIKSDSRENNNAAFYLDAPVSLDTVIHHNVPVFTSKYLQRKCLSNIS